MKRYYRRADAAVQIILVITWIYAFIAKTEWLLLFYFIIGGWYLISLIIHFIISGRSYRPVYRVFLYIASALTAFLLAGVLIFPVIIYVEVYLLLYAAPFMVALYTFNCVDEILTLRKRPMSLLK